MGAEGIYFGRCEAAMETDGPIILGQEQLPWISKPYEATLISVSFQGYPVFFYGSAVKAHDTLWQIASKMNGIQSSIVNRGVYTEISNIVTHSGNPACLRHGLIPINYSKHVSGARGFFTKVKIKNGDDVGNAYILVAACGNKNCEQDVINILTGSSRTSGRG